MRRILILTPILACLVVAGQPAFAETGHANVVTLSPVSTRYAGAHGVFISPNIFDSRSGKLAEIFHATGLPKGRYFIFVEVTAATGAHSTKMFGFAGKEAGQEPKLVYDDGRPVQLRHWYDPFSYVEGLYGKGYYLRPVGDDGLFYFDCSEVLGFRYTALPGDTVKVSLRRGRDLDPLETEPCVFVDSNNGWFNRVLTDIDGEGKGFGRCIDDIDSMATDPGTIALEGDAFTYSPNLPMNHIDDKADGSPGPCSGPDCLYQY